MFRINVDVYEVAEVTYTPGPFLGRSLVLNREIAEWLKSRGLHKVELLSLNSLGYGSHYVEFPSTARKEAIYFKIKWC